MIKLMVLEIGLYIVFLLVAILFTFISSWNHNERYNFMPDAKNQEEIER